MAEEPGLLASIWEHIDELRARVIRSLAAFFLMLSLVIVLGIATVDIAGFSLAVPWPDPTNNITVKMFQIWKRDLLPADVRLLNIGVGDLLIVQMQIGLMLAVMLSLPVVVYEVSKFISPALYRREKDMARRVLVPAFLLFLAGMLFAYYVVLPFTFSFLFQYTDIMGVDKTVAASEFADFVTVFLLAFGFIFDIPVFMVSLTWAGVVGAGTWASGWRWAAAGAIIVGAVITPDGSGVTQMIVALPMLGLYVVGCAAASVIEKRNRGARPT